MVFSRWCALVWWLVWCVPPLSAQVIEYESNGLHYQAQTKNGLTIQFAQLPSHLHDYAILQISVMNGSPIDWAVKPEDFVFQRPDGSRLLPTAPRVLVDTLLEHASRNDLIKLAVTYETGLYGMTRYKANNGYEQRRLNALAFASSAKLKAAATASALALIATKLKPGESTDGAVFYTTANKMLGPGKLTVAAAGEVFEFDNYTRIP